MPESCYARHRSLSSHIDQLLTECPQMKRQETLELCVPLSDNRQHWHKSFDFMANSEASEVLWGMGGKEGKRTVHIL